MNWPSRLLAALAVPLVLVLPGLGGCSALLGEEGPGAAASEEVTPERCAELLTEPKTASGHPGVTLLLADGSASTISAKGDERQDWAKLLAANVPPTGRTLVRPAVFGGDVRWRAGKLTPGPSKDEYQTKYAAQDVPVCLRRELDQAMAPGPGKAGSDILRALSEAGEELREADGAKRIIIATDGLSNTGCADLRAAPIGDHTAIPGIVQACRPEIPALDKNVEVRLVGLGKPAEGRPDVRTPHRTWLVSLWWELCKQSGATCPKPSAAAPERKEWTSTGKPPGDAPVTMPAITIERANPIVITVPEAVLFDTDSHTLAPRAQDAIAEIMRHVAEIDYTSVEVRGHSDARGTPERNQRLSDDRAAAVVAELRRKGATGLTAKGFGERRPRCSPQYRDGEPDRVAMACNRRVEVVIHIRT